MSGRISPQPGHSSDVPDSIPEVHIDAPEEAASPALRYAASTASESSQASQHRPSTVRILRGRSGSADPLPQTSRSTSRARSSTVGAPEAVGLDVLSSSPARPNPALLRPPGPEAGASAPAAPTFSQLNRARSGSEPVHSPLANPSLEQSDDDGASRQEPLPAKPKSRRRAFTSAAARPFIWSSTDKQAQSDNKSQTSSSQTQSAQDTEMNQRLVDFLDAVDPEIGTVSTLNNIQNSLFVPNLGSWVNRGALVRLTTPEARAANRYSQLIDEQEKLREKGRTTENNRSPAEVAALGASEEYAKALEERRPSSAEPTTHPDDASAEEAEAEKARKRAQAPLHFDDQRIPAKARLRGMSTSSMRSALSAPKLRHQPTVRGEYAVLPPNIDWGDWTEEEKAELDDYVRHLLHSKKEITRRKWRGFLKFCSRPLGLFVTVYSFMLFIWGLAWMLFLIGWINVGNRQAYFVEICDQILVALFALVGLGMIPWRTVDTYHMIYIAKYHRKILELRQKKGLPELCDDNDLPLERPPPRLAEEGSAFGFTPEEEHVLSPEEEERFLHHQRAFAKSHTFYRPHETETHHAFPLDLMIVAVCLLDFHSIFQLALASTTWSISYHHKYKKTLTSIILAFSLSVNITAGIVISVGDRRTRKREILEKRLIQSITLEAIERKHLEQRVAHRQIKEEERKAREGLRKLKEEPHYHYGNIQTPSEESMTAYNSQSAFDTPEHKEEKRDTAFIEPPNL